MQPNHLTEKLGTLQELMGAVQKLKLNKISGRMWVVAEVFKHISANFAAKIFIFTVCAFKWPYLFELETGFVHNAGETRQGGTGHGLSADCFCMIVLPSFCVHDIAKSTVVSGQTPPKRTTWFPCSAFGGTFARGKSVLRTDPGGKHSSVDIERLAFTCQKTLDGKNWGALWLALSEHGVSIHML